MTSKEALENIKRDMEYVTRLDFVKPIVRGEVQQELYKIYHRETPELDTIEKELKELEKQTQILKILKSKMVDIDLVNKVNSAKSYNCYCREYDNELTETEFDLLKEWLNEN